MRPSSPEVRGFANGGVAAAAEVGGTLGNGKTGLGAGSAGGELPLAEAVCCATGDGDPSAGGFAGNTGGTACSASGARCCGSCGTTSAGRRPSSDKRYQAT